MSEYLKEEIRRQLRLSFVRWRRSQRTEPDEFSELLTLRRMAANHLFTIHRTFNLLVAPEGE